MSDHWGGFDHHDDDHHDDLHDIPGMHDMPELPDTHEVPDLPDHTDHDPHTDIDHHGTHEESDIPDTPETLPVADDFPPHLEVGDLPEPVDGFPWVDASTLGGADTYAAQADPVDPHELAAYAGVEVPDGADPWSVLAASDDPAVAALARWWTPGEQ